MSWETVCSGTSGLASSVRLALNGDTSLERAGERLGKWLCASAALAQRPTAASGLVKIHASGLVLAHGHSTVLAQGKMPNQNLLKA